MTLADTATAIAAHLNRFAADPSISHKEWKDGKGVVRKLTCYWSPNAWRAGPRIMVRYIAYHNSASLTREQAERYRDAS